MRQIACFVVACLLLGGGLWLLYMQLFVSPVIKGWVLMSAGVLSVAGAAWLIGDYVRPVFNRNE